MLVCVVTDLTHNECTSFIFLLSPLSLLLRSLPLSLTLSFYSRLTCIRISPTYSLHSLTPAPVRTTIFLAALISCTASSIVLYWGSLLRGSGDRSSDSNSLHRVASSISSGCRWLLGYTCAHMHVIDVSLASTQGWVEVGESVWGSVPPSWHHVPTLSGLWRESYRANTSICLTLHVPTSLLLYMMYRHLVFTGMVFYTMYYMWLLNISVQWMATRIRVGSLNAYRSAHKMSPSSNVWRIHV